MHRWGLPFKRIDVSVPRRAAMAINLPKWYEDEERKSLSAPQGSHGYKWYENEELTKMYSKATPL